MDAKVEQAVENEMKSKKPAKKGRTLGIISLIIGIISIPLFFVYFIGPVIGVIGTILALISIPSTSEGRKDVSWASNIALAVNLLSVMGGLTLMLIIWVQEKNSLELETTGLNTLYQIFKLYR